MVPTTKNREIFTGIGTGYCNFGTVITLIDNQIFEILNMQWIHHRCLSAQVHRTEANWGQSGYGEYNMDEAVLHYLGQLIQISNEINQPFKVHVNTLYVNYSLQQKSVLHWIECALVETCTKLYLQML